MDPKKPANVLEETPATPTRVKAPGTPSRPMDTKTTLEMMRRRVVALEKTNDVIREALERSNDVIKMLVQNQNDLKSMLVAHVMHVRELPNNPMFLHSLVQKMDDLAAEGERMAELKNAGLWIPPQYIAHKTYEEAAAANNLVLRISIASRPNADKSATENYPRVEQRDDRGRWFEAIPFIRDHHHLTDEAVIAYLPNLDPGTEVFLEIIPGRVKEDTVEAKVFDEYDITFGGDDATKYTVTVTGVALPEGQFDPELSFQLNVSEGSAFVQFTCYDGADGEIAVPESVRTEIAQRQIEALKQYGTVFVAIKVKPEDDKYLLGSDMQPSQIDIGGTVIALGDAVLAAHKASGLTMSEWNALPQEDREDHIAKAVETLRTEYADSATGSVEDDGADLAG